MGMSPTLMRPRSFTPKNVATLAAWWSAVSSPTTLDASGNVSQWDDISGNKRHLLQTTANNRPAYNAGVLNGLPVVNFDGSNDYMSAAFTLAQPITYFLVYRFDTAYVSGNPRVFDGVTGNTMSFYAASSALMGLYAGGAAACDPIISDAQRTAFSITEIEANVASTALRLNGSAVSFSTTSTLGSGAPNGMLLGAFGTGGTAYGDVSFAEVVIYSSVISAANASKVRYYLGNKYGIKVA